MVVVGVVRSGLEVLMMQTMVEVALDLEAVDMT